MAPVRVLSTATATAACGALCSLPKEVSAAGTITFTHFIDSNCTNASAPETEQLGCGAIDLSSMGLGKQSKKITCDGTHVWVVEYEDTLNCDNTPIESFKYEMNTCVESENPANKGLHGTFSECTDPTSHSAASPVAIAMAAVIASVARCILL